MPEATTQTAKPKSKTQLPPFPGAVFPGVEAAPAAFRDMAEKSLSQAKDSYEKIKSAAEEATGLLEDTYATASKGAADYTLKMIEMARENSNATFDFAVELLGVKTFSDFVELSSAHARKQFETLSEQGKELATLAQKVATETTEPLKEGMTKAAKKAA
jgi:phasin